MTRGLYQLIEKLEQGDLILADRAFSSYGLIALLQQKGVDSLMRLHQKREGKLDWRKGKKIDSNSRLVTWQKPLVASKCGITQDEWKSLPEEITLRLIRCKGLGRDGETRTLYLVTSLLDKGQYPTEKTALLYAERWKIEVKFRDIKTTMKLEMLRVKSPELARCSVLMMQITYNLIKAKQALSRSSNPIGCIDLFSFKETLNVINELRSNFYGLSQKPQSLKREQSKLEQYIGERTLNIRPNRSEPRAVKQRPKPHALLTSPRTEYEEIPHRSNYRKMA